MEQKYSVTLYTREPDHPVLKTYQFKRKFEKLNATAARVNAGNIKQCIFQKALMVLETTPYVVVKQTARELYILAKQDTVIPETSLSDITTVKPS